MNSPLHLPQHPQRAGLHNEIHARPPQALVAPLAISYVVMLCDEAQRAASREHVATLLRDHHLPLPGEQTSHFRMDMGSFTLRWEMHTEFVTWTFMCPADSERLDAQAPETALQVVPQDWLAGLPGSCLSSLHLWALSAHAFSGNALVKHVLREDTLVASIVANGAAEVYTDFAMHSDGFSRILVRAGNNLSPRRLGRLVQRLLEIETYRMAALLGLPAARAASNEAVKNLHPSNHRLACKAHGDCCCEFLLHFISVPQFRPLLRLAKPGRL